MEFHFLIFDREISNDATTTIGYVQKSQASHMGEQSLNSHPTLRLQPPSSWAGHLQRLTLHGAFPKILKINRAPIAPGKNAMEDASPPPSPNGKGNSSFPSERCLCGPTHSETHPLNYTKSWNFFILVNQCCGWFSFWGNGFRVHWSMFIFLGDYPSKRLGVAAVPHRLPVAWKATRPRRLLFLLLQPSCILLREVQDFCV